MHYHLIGICGTAMASLAGMLQARGHRVTGSDEHVYPPMSTMLEALGIAIMRGYKGEHLDFSPLRERRGVGGEVDSSVNPTPNPSPLAGRGMPDCIVVGNAIPRGNPELEEVLQR